MQVFFRPQSDRRLDTQKTASFGESAIDDGSESPPLTSSLRSRQSASSAQESAYLRQASLLRWTRVALALLVLGSAATAVGCTSHVLRRYDQTVMDGAFYLPLWPVNVDVRPALATLALAAIAVLTALLYLVLALLPSPRSRFLVQNIVFVTMAAIGFSVTLLTIIYDQVVTYHTDVDQRDTLLTFTCDLYNNAQAFAAQTTKLGLPSTDTSLIPPGFQRLCIESQVSRWMMVALFVLEVFCLVVAVFGLVSEKRIASVRRSRRTEKSAFA